MPSQTKVEADLLFSLFKLGYSCWVQTELNSSFFGLVLHIIELNHVWFICFLFFPKYEDMNLTRSHYCFCRSYFIAWRTHIFFCASIGARLAFGNKSRYSFSVSFKFFIALIISRIRTWLVLPVMCFLIFSDLSFFHVVETCCHRHYISAIGSGIASESNIITSTSIESYFLMTFA